MQKREVCWKCMFGWMFIVLLLVILFYVVEFTKT